VILEHCDSALFCRAFGFISLAEIAVGTSTPKSYRVVRRGWELSVARANHGQDGQTLPELPYESWKDTLATLHRWTQVVGKVRLALTPLVNHWWNVPLYVTARGLTTSVMPYQNGDVEIWFDFIDQKLKIETSEGGRKEVVLKPQTVADFYRLVMAALSELGVQVKIWTMPCELPPEEAVAFEKDDKHKSYDAEAAQKFWHILVWADDVLKEFRAPFLGKASPVHFFWGSFDMAVTRFSGRRAPERPDADPVTREAYSHEVSSAGFWPGDPRYPHPAFYSYAAPDPEGFALASVRPKVASYNPQLSNFLLPYDDVRNAESPKALLLEFLQSTYEAAANLGKWDRKALER
jgi:hypothetical protein